MGSYTTISSDQREVIKNYLKTKENAEVSNEIKFDNNMYKEVRFVNKTNFGFRKFINGIMFLGKDDNIIIDKRIINELNKRFYYYNIFFDENKRTNMFNAIQSEATMKKSQNELEIASEGLEILIKQGVYDANNIKSFFEDLKRIRIENNNKLQELKNEVKKIETGERIYDDEFFDVLYEKYVDMLNYNFFVVKTVYSVESNFKPVKEAIIKEKKSLGVRMNKKINLPLTRLEEQIDYFNRLLRAYESVLHISVDGYQRFYYENEKKFLKERLELVRG